METFDLLGQSIPRLGLGCWAIGGPLFAGETALGYGEVDDRESIDAIECAYDLGIRLFDTAAVYGAGHSEAVLGKALRGKPDAIVSTKVGVGFDAASKQSLGPSIRPDELVRGVEDSLQRLQRDRIDLVFLHINTLAPEEAEGVFDVLDGLVKDGKVRAYGWSTDFSGSVERMAEREHFKAIQNCMNLFFSPTKLQNVIQSHDLVSFCRSPLAMGLLTGKFKAGDRLDSNDVRGASQHWMDYFQDGRVSGDHLATLEKVKDWLTGGGRTEAQGALAWIWRNEARAVPIPGFRNRRQVLENVEALEYGRLDDASYQAIERLMERPADYEERER